MTPAQGVPERVSLGLQGLAEQAGEAAAAVSPSEAAAEVAKADLSDSPPSTVGEPGELQAAGDTQSTPHAAQAGEHQYCVR